MPCYNPGPAVVRTVSVASEHLRAHGVEATIVVVSDGSTDGSDLLIDRLGLPEVVHVRHDRNRGKGAAIRTGFGLADADVIAFIDADGDLPPQQLTRLIAAERSRGADIVFGSKLHAESSVTASSMRRLSSWGYRRLIWLLFQLDVRDTQTGIKLFHRRVVDAVLPTLREDGFAIDLELFIAAQANGFTNFVEVPVILERTAGSTISGRALRRMVGDTLRLFWHAKVTLRYTRSASAMAWARTDVASPATGSGVAPREVTPDRR